MPNFRVTPNLEEFLGQNVLRGLFASGFVSLCSTFLKNLEPFKNCMSLQIRDDIIQHARAHLPKEVMGNTAASPRKSSVSKLTKVRVNTFF